MPPRYAYWTILIDDKPTAFRAREQEELLPTLHQLRRTNKDVVLKWFARGRLWETPEAAQAASRAAARRARSADTTGARRRAQGSARDSRKRRGRGRRASAHLTGGRRVVVRRVVAHLVIARSTGHAVRARRMAGRREGHAVRVHLEAHEDLAGPVDRSGDFARRSVQTQTRCCQPRIATRSSRPSSGRLATSPMFAAFASAGASGSAPVMK